MEKICCKISARAREPTTVQYVHVPIFLFLRATRVPVMQGIKVVLNKSNPEQVTLVWEQSTRLDAGWG